MSARQELMIARREATSSPGHRVPGDRTSSTRGQSAELASSGDFLVAFASGHHDNDQTIEAFARAGLVEETIAALALLCHLPIDIVERLMKHPETVYVLARGADLTWRSADAMLPLCARSRDFAEHQSEQIRARFARLTPQTARRFLQSFADCARRA